MGLGTKIKEALGSDKGHRSTPSQQRRVAPGAYPDSVADIPRTASTKARTWDATDTYSKEKQQQKTSAAAAAAATAAATTTKASPRTSDNASDEYTFSPVSDKENRPKQSDAAVAHNDESELIAPSPDFRIANNHNTINTAFAKDVDAQQNPYWGNIGKSDARHDARGLNGKGAVSPFDDNSHAAFIDDAGVPANGHSLGRNGTINNGDYSSRLGQTNARGYDDETYGSPILATVNHGQPHLAVDAEEGRVASMAATQLSHGSEYTESQEPAGLSYRNAAPDYGNAHHGTAGYSSGYPTAAANYHDGNDYSVKQPPQVQSPIPVRTNARGTFGSPQGLGDVHGVNTAFAMGSRAPDQYMANEREQSGSTGSSANGKSAGSSAKAADHYGPGHSGARVLHRCEHCGNDNDISKYFSRDVVYRLS